MQPSNQQHTYSTEQAAGLAGISYITLRRWLSSRDFRPSIGLGIGGGKTIWRFSPKDIAALLEYKALTYCKGRGRVGKTHKEAARQKSRRQSRSHSINKAEKRMWQRALGDRYEGFARRTREERRVLRVMQSKTKKT
jgi:hypothetical protein